MKKFLFSGVSLMSKIALTLVLSLIGVASANAVDLGQLEFDETYTVPTYQAVEAHFIAPATGTVFQDGGGLTPYTDAAHTQEVATTFTGDFSNGGKYTYEVEEGKTYYLYSSFVMNTKSITLRMQSNNPLEVIRTSPSTGTVLNLNTEETVYFLFNQEAEYTSCKIECGSYVQENVKVYGNGTTEFNVDVASLKAAVKAGTVSAGSTVSIIFDGLKAKVSGKLYKDQTLSSFDFIVSSVGVTKVSESLPSVFKSYWPAGDADGKIVLTFSDDLGDGAMADLVYGNTEGDLGADFYVETLNGISDGKTLTVDLTGKRRTNSDMITGGPYSTMLVKVYNIKDSKGFAVASEGQGTVGSYTYEFTFSDNERQNIYYDAEPGNGTSLKGKTSISIWISGLNTISFDGFKMTYTDAQGQEQEVVIPMSAVTKDEVSADGNQANFTFEIPAAARDQKNYTVCPNNLQSIDGYEYGTDLTVRYDAFVLLNVNPANGSRLASLAEGDIVTITPNLTQEYPEMYIVYEVEDLNPDDPEQAIVKTESWLNRQDNGTYTAEIPYTVKMLVGHTYRCTFTAWASEMDKNYKESPIGTASVEWFGATAPFKYSDVEFLSITPADGTELTVSDRVFKLEFDGMVTMPSKDNFIVIGSGATMPFESLVPVDPEDTGTFSNKWEATISESFMKNLDADLRLSFKAFDMDNLVVKGNEGLEDQTYLTFMYDVAAAYKDFEIFTNIEGLEIPPTVTEFIATSELGIMPSYNVAFGDAVVMDKARNVVATVTEIQPIYYGEIEDGQEAQAVTECHMLLDNAIDEAGTYILSIPRGMFVIGSETTSWKSAEKTVTFQVAGSGLKATSNPAEGKVASLKNITLTFSNGVMPTESTGNPTVTKEGGDAVEITNVTYNSTDENPWATEMTLVLADEITAIGNYVVTIPASYFYLQGSFAYSDEMTFKYEVVEETDPTADWKITPAQGKVEKLEKIEFTFTNQTEVGGGSGIATLSVNGEAAVNLPNAEWGIELNEMVQSLGQTYTADGTYVLNFPAGYFLFGSDGEESPAFTLTYEIGSAVVATEDYELYPDSSEVQESLNQFMLWSDKGFQMPDNFEASNAVVLDMTREVVAYVENVEATPGYNGGDPNEIVLTLNAPVDQAGNYVLLVPEGYLNIAGAPSAEKIVNYQVAGSKFEAVTDPAEGAVLSLNTIKVTLATGVLPTEMAGSATVTKEGGESVEAVIEMADPDGWSDSFTIKLPNEITEIGKYIVNIPAQYFYIQGTFAYSPEINFEYEIVDKLPDPTDNWVISPAQGLVEQLGDIEITFSDQTAAAGGYGRATLSIDGGEAVTLPDAGFGVELNEMVQPLGQTYTTPGKYVINFPAGYFQFGDDGDIESPAFTLTYEIKASGITGIAADANGLYVVYNVAGVKLVETQDASDLKNLAKGVYIINGVKIYVK